MMGRKKKKAGPKTLARRRTTERYYAKHPEAKIAANEHSKAWQKHQWTTNPAFREKHRLYQYDRYHRIKKHKAKLAYLRLWKEKHRPSPRPIEQGDPSLPPFGVMRFSEDGTKVQCHSCGRWLGNLNGHLRTHGLDKDIYKKTYNLPRTVSLLPPATAEKQRQAALQRDLGSLGRLHIPTSRGRPVGQEARLGVRIAASEQRKGIYTRGGNKTKS